MMSVLGIHRIWGRTVAVGALAFALLAVPRVWQVQEQFLTWDEGFTWRVVGYSLPDIMGRVVDDV